MTTYETRTETLMLRVTHVLFDTAMSEGTRIVTAVKVGGLITFSRTK